ncbi:cupredoxin domain-containing protein [Neobacillus cucumis]|uniref:cupredoxin domain-containing protein n=1 Tax=Neobacillus cucumis TaxID=1740721 RepID=UPI0018E02F5E|nr:cupredoxin domain-containing protein [Neobacillus cucumis]MBI0575938.1 cupredoxin domain-containing protein [Neobacillus cucumis]WHY90132.1 cupredoxin domain-containing protein [Neobacillus cucumis]
MRFLVFKKETLLFFLAVGFVLVTVSAWFILRAGDTAVFNQQSNEKVREIHMVTVEYKTQTKDGKELEAYRWDPGTIVLEKGEKAELYINGINGEEHPFYIEGTSIKGTVKKGEETVVPLQFDKEGTYRLVCEVHSDKAHNGPMIADIVVD